MTGVRSYSWQINISTPEGHDLYFRVMRVVKDGIDGLIVGSLNMKYLDVDNIKGGHQRKEIEEKDCNCQTVFHLSCPPFCLFGAKEQ